jgi:hypothetical protein
MDEDTIFPIFAPAACDKISGLEKAEFPDLDCIAGIQHRHAVHARVPWKDPLCLAELKKFRVYGGCVIALRGDAGPLNFFELHRWSVIERW